MMGLARRALAVALVVGAVILCFGLGASEAARLATHGWWWRAQLEPAPIRLDPPPHVPEGGLAVGRSADGATAISALRFQLADNEINPVLTLQVANDFSGPEIQMAACHSGDDWFGTQAGTWEAKPTAACDLGSVQGIPSEDGTEWTFPVGALALEGLLDVVIVPAEGVAPFEISFERPSSASLETTVLGDGGSARPPPPPIDFSFPPPAPSGTDFSPPVAPTRPFEPALTPEEQEPRPDASVSRSQETAFGRSTADLFADEEGDPRPLALLVLAAGLVLGALLWREPFPAPRLLGPLRGTPGHHAAPVEPEVRGLGRFARSRTGDPPKLV